MRIGQDESVAVRQTAATKSCESVCAEASVCIPANMPCADPDALSVSVFFARITRTVGMAPMKYLLGWRMALGKTMLRRKEAGVAEIAARVGYGSASAFSVAFTCHVGVPPMI